MTLNLYKTGSDREDGAGVISRRPLTGVGRGEYSVMVAGDLHGVYYTYTIASADGTEVESADPWAIAAGVNGLRSMVVDLSRTDPEGWQQDIRPTHKGAPVVWETHVRDFSESPSSGVPNALRGKYLAFTKTGTTVNGEGKAPTCLDYLKQLGVTHVQLQPIADIYTIDEATGEGYNWGYDILNYNVPEGSYSTNPFRGDVRVREVKQMILALHRAGIGVVLDVVYNHTYFAEKSWFHLTAPKQYYRHGPDGAFLNASGCGCETASEKQPFRYYMLKSLMYWAQEYHIDGFRLDLMGVHDVTTVNNLRLALDSLPGGKDILLYGEPWSCLPTGLHFPDVPANKDALKLLSSRVGVFSDTTRNAIAGPASNPAATGYVTGRYDADTVKAIKSAVCGLCRDEFGSETTSPAQAVQYVSCHDNYTLFDRLAAQNGITDYDSFSPTIAAQSRLAAAVWLCSAGIGFMAGGEEFARTKHGNGNSYNGPAETNAINWALTQTYAGTVAWYRGLIGLRPTMLPNCSPQVAQETRFLPAPEGVVLFTRPLHEGTYTGMTVAFNPTDQTLSVQLPAGSWTLLCGEAGSELWRQTEGTQCEGTVQLPPLQAMIWGRVGPAAS